MPELPEIALLGKYIASTSLNKKITGLDFLQTGLLQSPKSDFNKLKGKSFSECQQLGKYLFLKAEKELWLGFHFGMTGKLEFYRHEESPKYTHLVIRFEDDSRLAYVCRRKLGKIYLTPGVEDFKKEHSLGKHALDVSMKEFQELLKAKNLGFNVEYLKKVVSLLKERASFVKDFWELGDYFFISPENYDEKASKKVWKEDTAELMQQVMVQIEEINDFSAEIVQEKVKSWITSQNIGFGRVMQPFRLSLVGAMQGPDVFDIAAALGKEETLERLRKAVESLG